MSPHCWPVPGHTPPHPRCTEVKQTGSNEDHYSTGFPGTVVSDEVIFEQRPEGSERMSCDTIWGAGFQVLSPECGWSAQATARKQVTEAKGVRGIKLRAEKAGVGGRSMGISEARNTCFHHNPSQWASSRLVKLHWISSWKTSLELDFPI